MPRCCALPMPGGAVIERARLRSCERHQLLHRFRRHRGVDHEQELEARGLRHRREVLQRIVRRRAKMGYDRQDVVGREKPRLAVGRALRDEIRGEDAAARRAIVHDDRMRPADAAAMVRAMVSGEPPGGSGTMNLTGREGKPSAPAEGLCAAAQTEPRPACSGESVGTNMFSSSADCIFGSGPAAILRYHRLRCAPSTAPVVDSPDRRIEPCSLPFRPSRAPC